MQPDRTAAVCDAAPTNGRWIVIALLTLRVNGQVAGEG